MQSSPPDGFSEAPPLEFERIQLDPRAEDALRDEMVRLGLNNDDTLEAVHSYLDPYIKSLQQVASELEAVEVALRSLSRKRGAVKRSLTIRMDDFVALEVAMTRIKKAAHVCEGDPLSLIQALLILGGGR